MSRYVALVEYQGTAYHGWQVQGHDQRTVQQAVIEALSKVANEPIKIVCAGRTDTGVHAIGQVIHFDSIAKRSAVNWRSGSNRYLPHDIAVRQVIQASKDFHARFDAISREYHYIINNTSTPSAILANFATHIPFSLDVSAMQKAADCLVGRHDFSAFRGASCQAKSPVRDIHFIQFTQQQQTIIAHFKANAFLHHMVRNIMGSLLTVGQGKQPADWLAELLKNKNRKLAAATAPPQGLFLSQVNYPHPELQQLSQYRSDLFGLATLS